MKQASYELEVVEQEYQQLEVPISDHEFETARQAVLDVRDDISRELAKFIRERHARLIEEYQALDAKTCEFAFCSILSLSFQLSFLFVFR